MEQIKGSAGANVTNNSISVNAAVNRNGHGLSVEHVQTRGSGSTTTVAGQANIFQNKNAEMNASAYHTHNRHLDTFGGGMDIKTATGHSATLGVNHVPKFNMTAVNASGSANLYTSPSGNLNVAATANAMRHTSGPFRGKSDMGYGLNMQYKF
ncbi:attacin-A [Drosophila mojavensis]|uniref:Attacin C-terminal domain-containing protein n=1 Tax=Drosophila mojavensis TaxID=7230 RepID=B4K4R2_DROMO|nr:attacin-A [Drosophila mojavensis]EDW15038.2 uncharacterized protein Dmoj_GI24598 [Drosophila mojavensis]